MFKVGDVVKVVRGEPGGLQTYTNGDVGVVDSQSSLGNDVNVHFFRDGKVWANGSCCSR